MDNLTSVHLLALCGKKSQISSAKQEVSCGRKKVNILRLNWFAKFVLRNLLSITESKQLCFANLLRFSITFNTGE